MRYNKGNTVTVIIIVIALAAVGWWFWNKSQSAEGETTALVSTSTPASISNIPTLKVNGTTIKLLVADTPESRELGLGGRASLPDDEAMIFVFDVPGRYEFWMKDMKFPLDMVWLDKNFKVVHIESNISPSSYPDQTFMPESDSQYVIEANSFFAQKNNLKIGDIAEVNLKK
jgi:uncharacterized membrane protein (UPF0127 family)